jgi:hypothetical protein
MVVLAMTYHDPEGRLFQQLRQQVPVLASLFGGLAVNISPKAPEQSFHLFADVGALINREASRQNDGYSSLGDVRRAVVQLALTAELPFVMACDCDRALHWAEHYPDELARVVRRLPDYDFTILGRTPRAFATHPRVQRDTEAIINQVYATVSGHGWDITAAARGLSRRAAEAIIAGCPDATIGVDASWPLFVQRAGGLSMGFLATEGLEFETADRFGVEVEQVGGVEQWVAQLDRDPRQWADRLHLAEIEVASMAPYVEPDAPNG